MTAVCLSLILNGRSMAGGREHGLKSYGPDVVVYVRQDNIDVARLGRAERTASGIFAKIGVVVAFRAHKESGPAGEAPRIEMQLEAKVPAQFHPGALAYAMPFGTSGTRIHVFCDRVLGTSPEVERATLLGYVMAHEIAHVLEGVNRHSADGVMKARWETPDYRRMMSGALALDPADAELIRSQLRGRKDAALQFRNGHGVALGAFTLLRR